MNNPKYYIKSEIVGSTSIWRICDEEGNILCHLHGGYSARIAVAALDNLNNPTEDNNDYGWNQRLHNYLHPSEISLEEIKSV